MERSDIDPRTLRSGFIIGLLVVAVVVFLTAVALGADTIVAAVAGIGLGIFVGGSIGALLSARVAQLRSSKKA